VIRGRLAGALLRPGSALLDGWSDDGRWTIALPDPREEFRIGPGQEHRLDAFLRDAGEPAAVRGRPGAPPFLSGWVGFVSYEVGAAWEGAPPRPAHPPEPAAVFFRHEAAVAVSPEGRLSRFGAAEIEVEPVPETPARASSGEIRESMPWERYRDAHEAIRKGIAAGDFYQVNLTRRFSARVPAGCGAGALFGRLAGEPPPPYSVLLRGRGWDVLSASPELFLRADLASGVVEMRPIKGTAPRHEDPARDRESAQRLLASIKDRAENVMIVDLCRNDLGRVCEAGSVQVTDLCRLRSHRVHHLESTVRGRLRPGATLDALFRATFPPGSVTGAPKRAAVAAIRGVEPEPRGIYTGAVGFIDRRGRAAFNVAIRTAVLAGGSIRYHAGGGIVWDSTAQAEWEESRLKAEEFFRMLGRP
jgi:para-aminobenzoate synthetase component 1